MTETKAERKVEGPPGGAPLLSAVFCQVTVRDPGGQVRTLDLDTRTAKDLKAKLLAAHGKAHSIRLFLNGTELDGDVDLPEDLSTVQVLVCDVKSQSGAKAVRFHVKTPCMCVGSCGPKCPRAITLTMAGLAISTIDWLRRWLGLHFQNIDWSSMRLICVGRPLTDDMILGDVIPEGATVHALPPMRGS